MSVKTYCETSAQASVINLVPNCREMVYLCPQWLFMAKTKVKWPKIAQNRDIYTGIWDRFWVAMLGHLLMFTRWWRARCLPSGDITCTSPIKFLILLNYAATSSCLAFLQRSGVCAAHNYLVLATRVLKLSTLFACTTLSSSWFQSIVVLGKKEFFHSSVLQWVTTYGLLFFERVSHPCTSPVLSL